MDYKILFLLIVLLPSISATAVLHIQNNQTQPGETILATITTHGEFVQKIANSQIKFFQGRRQISLDSDIMFYNGTYYLYIYTNTEKNFTLNVENVLDEDAGKIESTTLIRNISVSRKNLINVTSNVTYTKIVKITPGFVFSSSLPEFKITNVGTSPLNVTFNNTIISLSPSESHLVKFHPNQTFSFAKFSTYKNFLVPVVYFISEDNTSINKSRLNFSSVKNSDLHAVPKLLFAQVFVGDKSKQTIQLFNFGDKNLTDLRTSTSINFIKMWSLDNMVGRGVQNFTMGLNPVISRHFSGEINVSYNENGSREVLKIPVSIFVLPKGASKDNFTVSDKNCSELSGEMCEAGMICNGTTTFTKGGDYCCLASCVNLDTKKVKSGGAGWFIAIVIFVILGSVGYYFYLKQKKVSSATPADSLHKMTQRFEKRMAGKDSLRTSGKLDKS